jgi:hypothetical protein
MKKDETIIPNVWEVETLNETRVRFSMQSDNKHAPSIFVMIVEKVKTNKAGEATVTDTIEVLLTADEAEAFKWAIGSCIPPSCIRNNP